MQKKHGYEKLARNIRVLRKAHGETLDDLSEAIGCSKSTISYYENSKSIPNHLMISKIAKHYRITEDELLRDDFSHLKNLSKVRIQDPAFVSALMERMFPIISSPDALAHKSFKKAYDWHKSFFQSLTIHSKFDFSIIDQYIKLYEEAANDDIIEAVCNIVCLLIFEGCEYSAQSKMLVENIEIFGTQNLTMKKFFEYGYLPSCKNEDDAAEYSTRDNIRIFLESNDASLTSLIGILKQDSKYSELGDYYLAWRYLLGIVDNTLSLEMNFAIGQEMLQTFGQMENHYVNNFNVRSIAGYQRNK